MIVYLADLEKLHFDISIRILHYQRDGHIDGSNENG